MPKLICFACYKHSGAEVERCSACGRMIVPRAPDGFIQVSKKEFFEQLYASKKNIMPHDSNETFTTWEVQGFVWGWSWPGWRNPMAEKAYFILERKAVPEWQA